MHLRASKNNSNFRKTVDTVEYRVSGAKNNFIPSIKFSADLSPTSTSRNMNSESLKYISTIASDENYKTTDATKGQSQVAKINPDLDRQQQ